MKTLGSAQRRLNSAHSARSMHVCCHLSGDAPRFSARGLCQLAGPPLSRITQRKSPEMALFANSLRCNGGSAD